MIPAAPELARRIADAFEADRIPYAIGSSFDTDYVRRMLVEIVGEQDERIVRWDRLVEDACGA